MIKKTFLLIFTIIGLQIAGLSQQTQPCSTCLGTGGIICPNCGGTGAVMMTFYDPYYGYYNQTVICPNCQGFGRVVCPSCLGRGYHYSISFNSNGFSKVRVTNCEKHSRCSCTTYIGYKRDGLDQYKGACENIVNGHTCGHGPKAHGLTEY